MNITMGSPMTPGHSKTPAPSVYWRILAIVSSWALLAGYLLFTVALGSPKEMLRVGKVGLEIVSGVLVILPLVVSLVLVVMFREYPSFLLNRVYIPFFGSSILGIFNAAVHIFCRGLFPLGGAGLAYVILSSISTGIYGIAALFMFWKVNVGSPTPGIAPFEQQLPQWSYYWPTATDDTALLSDDELQRRQLLRLLHANNADRPPSQEVIKNTFRIDLPNVVNHHRDQNRYSSIPSKTAQVQYSRQHSTER